MSEPSLKEKIWPLLSRVSRPGRYVGNEWNSIRKNHDRAAIKMVLAFPELYEIGMSNLGARILYEAVNRREGMLAERVFAPHTDMEELMSREGIPLFTLESFTPVKDFQVVGFSLQHELNYPNILTMLHLAGIPLHAGDRDSGPLVVGGGTCAYNPEPLAPFFDFLVLGEGEEVLIEVLEKCREELAAQTSRKNIRRALAGMDGVYVPSLYRAGYDCRGRLESLAPVEEGVPEKVNRRVVKDLEAVPYPTAPVVPYTEIVHDRAVLEIARGCPRGCRFCQAGITYRPARFRSRETLVGMARRLLASTGYQELSLVSLSSTDYPYLEQLLNDLADSLEPEINLSLPSQRLDAFSVKLADKVQKRHKSSLTFAPEAGTERLRKVINKNITDEEIYEAVGRAFASGWRLIKLYFMIGLPTEKEEDLEGIYLLCRNLLQIFKQSFSGKLKITASVSTLIPKPHTPFQWEPQITVEESYRRVKVLRELFSGEGKLELKWHQPEVSFLEAALSRGDRRVAGALERAWRKGSRLDNWTEYFYFPRWEEAFLEEGLSLEDYARCSYGYEDLLPWAHLNTGISLEYLKREHRRALKEELTQDCLGGRCAGCGLHYCTREGDLYCAED